LIALKDSIEILSIHKILINFEPEVTEERKPVW